MARASTYRSPLGRICWGVSTTPGSIRRSIGWRRVVHVPQILTPRKSATAATGSTYVFVLGRICGWGEAFGVE